MSEFHITVIQIDKIGKHPNADTLSIAEACGYPVIFRTGEFQEGDLAVYYPIDSIMPETPEWSFLGDHKRVKAKKIRGVFSRGLLGKAKEGMVLNQNVQELTGVTKWEPVLSTSFGNEGQEEPQGILPIYTDIEGYPKWKNTFINGEEVAITEKLHGTNFRCGIVNNQFYVGSHHRLKKEDDKNAYWNVAKQNKLAEKLKKIPDVILYGEIYGNVQKGFPYGTKEGYKLAIFDMLDLQTGVYLNYDLMKIYANSLNLIVVPELFRGKWAPELVEYRNGKSTLDQHTREGIVIKPIVERYDNNLGRVILKYVGEDYLLSK